jgi:hypothetical protein
VDAGIATYENIQQALRHNSGRKRSGSLVLIFPQTPLGVQFHQGRVVGVSEGEALMLKALTQRLEKAGLLGENIELPASHPREAFEKLKIAVPSIDAETFRFAWRHAILDCLYGNLSKSKLAATPCTFEFRAGMVPYDSELSPTISVGQLLLDLTALEDEEQELSKRYAADVTFQSNAVSSPALTLDERWLAKACATPATISDLAQRSLLSKVALRQALQGLWERGLLKQCEKRIEVKPAEVLGDDAFEAISGAIDKTFSEALAAPSAPLPQEQAPVIEEIKSAPQKEAASVAEPKPKTPEPVVPQQKERSGWGGNQYFLRASWVPLLVFWLFLIALCVLPLYFWPQPVINFW